MMPNHFNSSLSAHLWDLPNELKLRRLTTFDRSEGALPQVSTNEVVSMSSRASVSRIFLGVYGTCKISWSTPTMQSRIESSRNSSRHMGDKRRAGMYSSLDPNPIT